MGSRSSKSSSGPSDEGLHIEIQETESKQSQDISRKRKRDVLDEVEWLDEDRDDPLLLSKVKTRANKKKKVKKVHMTSVTKVRRKPAVQAAPRVKELILVNPEAKARRYQLEFLEKALHQNTILYLETGCGKTLIAVLLIKALAKNLRIDGEKRIVVFLVPTVHLVQQQSDVVEIHTDLKVGRYWGDKGVDYWDLQVWQKEIALNEVMVMTAQIFLDGLLHGFFKLDMVELLILDECHHATKNHAYAKIMRTFYHTSTSRRPKIFGMTASPVTRKGVTTSSDCADELQRLEDMLDSKVLALKDRSEVEAYAPTPNIITKHYSPPFFDTKPYKLQLEALKEKYQKSSGYVNGGDEDGFKDKEEFVVKLHKRIAKLHSSLEYCLEQLGFWCTYKAADYWLKGDSLDHDLDTYVDIANALKKQKDAFLREAMQVLQSALPQGLTNFGNTDDEVASAVKAGLMTPKVQLLVNALLKYREVDDISCIVFVDRVVAAVVLASVVTHLGCLSTFLRSDSLTGFSGPDSNRNQQLRTIESFRAGKVNLLVATDVAEEGLDVQSCKSVIRFDIPKTAKSSIQSRGRARRPGSDFIVLIERDNVKQENLLHSVMTSEASMREQALDRVHIQPNASLPPQVAVEAFHVEATGCIMDTNSSVAFIYRYCSKLPGDKYYIPRPEFFFEEKESLHVCTIKLPPNAPIPHVVGSARRGALLAKQVACLEACKILYANGALNVHLLPISDNEQLDEEECMKLKNTTGAGTNKQKELHSTVVTAALQGGWATSTGGACLHAYKLMLTSDTPEDKAFTNFVFLLDSELDDDVAHLETQLYLTRGRVARACFAPAGKVKLTSNQVMDAKAFQELLFNGMFSKLIRRTRKEGEPDRLSCLLTSATQKAKLWPSNRIYLLLPLVSNSCADLAIDWEGLRATAKAGEALSHAFNQEKTQVSVSLARSAISFCKNGFASSVIRGQEGKLLQLAEGRTMCASQMVDAAVITIHTGKIYSVTQVLRDITARSPFPETKKSQPAEFSSYFEFFKGRHGWLLQYPDQPLLQLKQTHRPHNLLVKQLEKENGEKSNGVPVEMPPELCLVVGFSSSVVRTSYLLPSFMHHVHEAMVASQLRSLVQTAVPHCPTIPVMRIVEALTTLRCEKTFSMEGLELLGDSFLKYAVSRKLFLVYERKHEGQLSARRMRAICNATLHGLAVARGLPGYIRDEPFHATRWVAPGMSCPKVVMCRCNLKNLHGNINGQTRLRDQETVTETLTKTAKPKPLVKIGKSCINGHRWLCSKTIADVTEALIGAYLFEGGSVAALSFMLWAGIDINFDPSLMKTASRRSLVGLGVNPGVDLDNLEKRIGYTFCNKGLLLEAMTHASYQDLKGGCCYQRLEFLGDAVLDLLISQHLFTTHPGLTPGRLTALRSAAVNNERFARVAVQHKFHSYLRHGSGFLLNQIQDFVKAIEAAGNEQKNSSFGWDGVQGPKVLGDLVESIAGAILVDTCFNLETVWTVMKPLLSPIVTPETLTLHPVCELQQLCNLKEFELHWLLTQDGNMTIATAKVNTGDDSIVGTSHKIKEKTAKKDAAQKILAMLETRGLRLTSESTVLTSSPSEMALPVPTPAFPSYVEVCSGLEAATVEICPGLEAATMEVCPAREAATLEVCPGLEASTVEVCSGLEASAVEVRSGLESGTVESFHGLEAVTRKVFPALEAATLEVCPGLEASTVEVCSGLEAPAVEVCSGLEAGTVEKLPGLEAVTMKVFPGLEAAMLEVFPAFEATTELEGVTGEGTVDRERMAVGEGGKDPAETKTVDSGLGLPKTPAALLRYLQIAAVKRKVEVQEDACRANAKRAKYSWSRDMAILAPCSAAAVATATPLTSLEDVWKMPLQPQHEAQAGGLTSIFTQKVRTVNSRQGLNEVCMIRKWCTPKFEMVLEEGMAHARRFTFSVVVNMDDNEVECRGESKKDKKQARESAASAMLLLLRERGIIPAE